MKMFYNQMYNSKSLRGIGKSAIFGKSANIGKSAIIGKSALNGETLSNPTLSNHFNWEVD